ncbi:MAG: pseudouridine synthase [Lacibacter sp.]
MANHYFQRFSGKKSNAQKKEEIRQEKRKARAEKRAWFEAQKKRAQEQPGESSKARSKAASKKAGQPAASTAAPAPMPLNKYIAHCGVCSRRDAANLIKEGKVKVNNTVVTEPGYKVQPKDEVRLNGKVLTVQKELVYILLNKPKDYITTAEDPKGRKTVLDLIKLPKPVRIYPVGRLDRNTTGVLLLTNDGELTQKLSHPSFQVKKVYEVTLDRPLEKHDFERLLKGVQLEDGFIAPDAIGYADAKDKRVIGIEIHSGRNRIVRRMFEHLGYDVKALDRVLFANLSKKNVERGKWRHLTEKEVRLLKYLNKSFVKKVEEKKAKNRNEE